MNRTIWRVLAVLLPLALVSCALPLPTVDDVALASIALVKPSDVPKQDRDAWFREIDGPLVRATFTSSHDFQKLARDWNYSIGNAVAACRDGAMDETKPLAGYPAVYDRHGPIFMYADERPSSGPGNAYHFYFALRADTDADLPTDVVQHGYDLSKRPQDVCFRIVGLQEVDGDGWGFSKFRSNVVTIPRKLLVAALTRR